jgi:arylsulfatase
MLIVEAKSTMAARVDSSAAARLIAPRPSVIAGRTEFTYTQPVTGIPGGDAPKHGGQATPMIYMVDGTQ